MGVLKTFKRRSRQNHLVAENIQLRHLGRSMWTALEQYGNPENWEWQNGSMAWAANHKNWQDPAAIAREALGVNHQDSGEHCGLLHKDEANHAIAECFHCPNCREWIRGDDAGKMSWCYGVGEARRVLE